MEQTKQQTAVEWLADEISYNLFMWPNDTDWMFGLVEKAKQMEKEQIVKAIDSIQLVSRRYYKDGTDWKYWDDVLGWEVPTSDENEYFGLSITGEKYYKQTYGTE